MIGNIKDLVKARLVNIEHEILDNIIHMAIEESIDMISTYCNLNEVFESIQQGDTKIYFRNSKQIFNTD